MRFNDTKISNFEWVDGQILSFEVYPNDEMLKISDEIRASKGFEDLVRDSTNDVWYNYYLDVDIVKETVILWFSCNNGEKDDYANYTIDLSEEEIKMFIWKAFRQFAKEMDECVDF